MIRPRETLRTSGEDVIPLTESRATSVNSAAQAVHSPALAGDVTHTDHVGAQPPTARVQLRAGHVDVAASDATSELGTDAARRRKSDLQSVHLFDGR